VPEPEPTQPALLEPDPEPAEPPVCVVSVDELLERLLESGLTEPEEPPAEEPSGVLYGGILHDGETGDIMSEPVPLEIAGMDQLLAFLKNLDKLETQEQARLELLEQTVNHPMLTTPFEAYTVTEGLLLLLLLCAFLSACVKLLKGGFAWLR